MGVTPSPRTPDEPEPSPVPGSVESWTRALVIAGVALCLTLGAIAASDLRGSIGRPYAGFAFYANGVLVGPLVAPIRFGEATAALLPRDRIVSVDGQPVAGGAEVLALVDARAPGDVVVYGLERQGARLEVPIPVGTFTNADYWELAAPVFLGATLLLLLGAAPALLRPRQPEARVWFLFALGGAGAFGFTAYDNFVGYRFVPWSLAFIVVMKGALAHLALVLPTPLPFFRRHRTPILVAIYGAMALQSTLYGWLYFRDPEATRWLGHLTSIWIGGSVAWLGVRLIGAAFGQGDVRSRQLARIILPAPLIGCISALLLFASARQWVPFPIPLAVHLAPIWVAFGVVAYAMLTADLFDLDARLRRGITGAFVLLIGSLGYLVLFALVSRAFGSGAAWVANVAALSVLFVLVSTMGPLRRAIEVRTEDWLHPGRRAEREVLGGVGEDLPGLRDPEEIAGRVRAAVSEAMGADPILLWAAPPGEALASVGEASAALEESHPLALGLRKADGATTPAAASEAGLRREMKSRGLELLVPFRGDRIVGGIGLGPRGDGRPYDRDDEQGLELLAAQASLAFQNAIAFRALRALEARLSDENQDLRAQLETAEPRQEGVVGRAPAFAQVLSDIEQVAPTDAAVLILGETGTGKEVLAQTLHRLSSRADRPFEKVACGAIPETLLESEFFGHERGAFTGAVKRRIGRLEAADGGTVFLDDVDALPLAVQAKLLRAVQQGEVQRLGSSAVSRVDVRILAASNQDLLQRVEEGSFRQDLYYRLAVVPVHVPPLRERLEDLPLLVQHLAEQEARRRGGEVEPFSRAFFDALAEHAWPGNVRELRNVVQRAVVLGETEALATLEIARPEGTT